MRRIFIFTPFGFILFLIFLFLFWPFSTPADGEHTGIITATEFTKSSYIFPNRIVYIKTDVTSTQEESYCAKDDRMFEELRKMQRDRKTVTVHYSNGVWLPPWVCDRQSVITEIVP